MPTSAPTPPNILWIVSEDCPPWFGCYGDELARTPHLDELSSRGVVFEQAFSSFPVCAPSRFGMLTGVSAESHGPAHQMRARAPRPAWLPTYPQTMRELGYYCTNNAKTDYNLDVDPDELWDDCSSTAHWRGRGNGRPFLAVFNFDGTHESSIFGDQPAGADPEAVRVPAFLPDTPEVRHDIAATYAHIAEMDAYVGALLHQLDQDGLADSTIVVQTSDHGGITPRSKRFCWDEGLRVPLIVTAPAGYAHLFPDRGSRVTTPVSTLAIPPTLIELGGGTPPPVMQEPSLVRREFTEDDLAFGARNRMDERPDLIRTVRDHRYRFVRNYLPHRPWGRHQAFAWLAAGYQSWEQAHSEGRLDPAQDRFWGTKPAVELYDLAHDPDEVHDLADHPDLAQVRQRLDAALHRHLIEVNDNGFLPEGSPHEGYENSRVPGAYPLDRVLEIADSAAERDPSRLPELLEALGDEDATVRRWAAMGILALGPATQAVAAPLRRLLDDPDPFVALPALECLAGRGEDAALTRLAELAGPTHPWPVRVEALDALTALGPDRARACRDAVAAAAGDEVTYVRSAGRHLLARIDGTYTPETTVFDLERLRAGTART